MKAPKVEMGRALRNRPRDHRGYPVPFIAAILDGRVQFPVVDPNRWSHCVRHGKCAICAQRLPDFVAGLDGYRADAWYIGGKLCRLNRLFYDPGMCEGCARYAIKVCPYLALPSYKRTMREPDLEKGIGKIDYASDIRPGEFMLGHSRGYKLVKVNGEPLLQVTPWEAVEWWANGAKLSEEKL